MFAIVDIETTGGQPSKDRITEIAVILHNGREVVQQYSTLVNPYCNIPYNITRITGITNEMVQDAPGFPEIARQIVELTEGAVFVAHSVHFDYGFIKSAFHDLGYNYQRKTLCTVRLSRSAFPGLPSYSLGNLCQSLDIEIHDRHRALGDATATALLFERILTRNPQLLKPEGLPAALKKTNIPPNLDEQTLRNIPEGLTGVYYFHNTAGEVVYVGKSTDIRKRMYQHFAFKVKDSQKSLLMRETIASISYEPTGSELVALLLESDEIKRLRPIFNQAQKRSRLIPFYGIFSQYDAFGYINLYVERLKEGDNPLRLADNFTSARELLQRLMHAHQLCSAKCDLHHSGGACFERQIHKCAGACVGEEPAEMYNQRVLQAMDRISFQNESFFLIDKGRQRDECAVVCIQKGKYLGFGFADRELVGAGQSLLLSAIRRYSHNSDIQTILCNFLKKDLLKIPMEQEG